MEHEFEGFTVLQLNQPLFPELGKFKVSAFTMDPLNTNEPPRAWVGDQELQAVTVDQFGLSVDGYVETMPSDTDTLSIQLYGGIKFDTGLTKQAPPPIS